MEHIRKSNKKLGVGAKGVVYEGYDEECGRFVAVKEIPFFDGGCGGVCSGDDAGEEEDPSLVEERRAIVREISLMERFEHPNLVAYYGARRSSVGVQIIMEFVNGGSLDALIRRHGCLRESVVRSYTHDILDGLAYLHDTARVCHRDVKPANVLITADGRCKLTDFGVSKLLDDNGTMKTAVGTPWYMAPEIVNGNTDEEMERDEVERDISGYTYKGSGGCSYTTAADIWSLGVTVYEMISGRKPFGGDMKNPAAVLFSIASSDAIPPRLPDGCYASLHLRDFLDLCFVRDPRVRPRARELLMHSWFSETHSPKSIVSSRYATRRESTSSGVLELPSVRSRPTLRPSLSMLDTADLAGGFVSSSLNLTTASPQERHSRENVVRNSQIEEGKSKSGRGRGRSSSGGTSERHSGLWGFDGHYVDLPITLSKRRVP